jgi:putative hydrolase of the HAD superfamily/5'-nucleotidase
MNLLSRHRVVLLDLNGTFMFGGDRFGPGEDFHATYRSLGGSSLSPDRVEAAIRSCFCRMAADYENPAKHDDFPGVAEALRAADPGLSEAEVGLLERAFAAHELGRVPEGHADFLRRLAGTHRLGLVANVWAGKGPWLGELRRAGVLGLFDPLVFSSDTRSVKPSGVLFELALRPFGVPRSEVLFVGDSLRCDIRGAKAAGLSTVWINPAGGADADADLVVGSLLDLRENAPRPG